MPIYFFKWIYYLLKRGGEDLYLQSDQLAVNFDLLGQEIGTNGGLVLRAVLLVHISVHQRGLAHAALIVISK